MDGGGGGCTESQGDTAAAAGVGRPRGGEGGRLIKLPTCRA